MNDSLKQGTTKNANKTSKLADSIRQWGKALGFQAIGISDINLATAEQRLQSWLDDSQHGDMEWMASHGQKRTRPEELLPGTCRVISARMDYLPNAFDSETILASPDKAFVSRYALGRDYHKLMRKRLQALADQIQQQVQHLGYRVFVDSAPVMEKPLAEKAGLGWIGKHTNLINKDAGSWFFLGEIYVDIPLAVDEAAEGHCGTCQACMDICPTRAIVAPYQLDARLCISYLTIEHKGAIPEQLRPLMGNRIYGCDDCQLCCPWNRFAQLSVEPDFLPRQRLDDISLLEVFSWDENQFLHHTEGSAIRRIGHERWLRNIAVALGNAKGNAPASKEIVAALEMRKNDASPLVREHVLWALQQHKTKNA